MLFGEYAVLAGAWACALPVKFRQNFEVSVNEGQGHVRWQSFDYEGKEWMNCQFRIHDEPSELLAVLRPLQQMLRYISIKRPDLCGEEKDLHVRIKASFRKEWGLGSSSALIANMARWSETNPFDLMDVSFPGSGYDVATAFQDQALLYRLNESERVFEHLSYLPDFLLDYRVVFLGKKVNSRESVSETKDRIPELNKYVQILDKCALNALNAADMATFNGEMRTYEQILADELQITPTGALFPEYPGFMKSLGAWGGDALLAEYIPDVFEQTFGQLVSFKLGEIVRWK